MDNNSKPVTPSGKNKLALVLIILGVVLIVLVIIGVFAFRFLWQKVETQIETTPSAAVSDENGRGGGGGSVSPGTSPSGGFQSPAAWPTDLSSSILPPYSGGTVTQSGKTVNPGSWSITITGTTQAEFDAYRNLLASQGWTVTPNRNVTNDYLSSKAGWNLTTTYSATNQRLLIALMEDV